MTLIFQRVETFTKLVMHIHNISHAAMHRLARHLRLFFTNDWDATVPPWSLYTPVAGSSVADCFWHFVLGAGDPSKLMEVSASPTLNLSDSVAGIDLVFLHIPTDAEEQFVNRLVCTVEAACQRASK